MTWRASKGTGTPQVKVERLTAMSFSPERTKATTSFFERPVTPYYFFYKNDSLRTAIMREIRGCDEMYDGSHLYHDTEFALRLAATGATFLHSKRPLVRIVQMRHVIGHLTRTRPVTDNERLLDETKARIALGVLTPKGGGCRP